MRLFFAFMLAFALVVPAAAHHGWGSYDADNPMTIEGVIVSSAFEQPHTEMTLTIDGSEWLVTLAPPSRMNNRGALADFIAPGKMVKAHGYPRRDGTKEMRAEWIEVDGQHFELR
jgi:hypothetical protein